MLLNPENPFKKSENPNPEYSRALVMAQVRCVQTLRNGASTQQP